MTACDWCGACRAHADYMGFALCPACYANDEILTALKMRTGPACPKCGGRMVRA